MMTELRIRTYNVRFGDAILITVPDKGPDGQPKQRHILIDVGNSYNKEGGDDAVFKPVVEDILDVLDGESLDLYVMTHEHLDHTQGLLYCKTKHNLELRASHAWLTASAAIDYYEQFPDAKKAKLALDRAYFALERHLAAFPEETSPWLDTLLSINNPRKRDDCVDYLRTIADVTHFVHREFDLTGAHPFIEARFEIWAPEEDTSEYYGRFQPATFSLTDEQDALADDEAAAPLPPGGVDAGAFYNLLQYRSHGHFDNLLALDKAKNNTSVVFSLEWRGWRLLFTGDAEERSWKTMNKFDQLKPVDFLKASHHGSGTGIPESELLEKILPVENDPNLRPRIIVTTYPGQYNLVPNMEEIEERLTPRGKIKFTDDGTIPDGGYYDLLFEPRD